MPKKSKYDQLRELVEITAGKFADKHNLEKANYIVNSAIALAMIDIAEILHNQAMCETGAHDLDFSTELYKVDDFQKKY